MKKTIIIFLIVFLSTGFLSSQDDFETPVAKTYKLEYKKVEKILPLLRTIMSNKGSVETSEEFNIFVLKDLPSVLIQVDNLVKTFDVPLTQVVISIRLLLGFNPEPRSADELIPSVSDSAEVSEFLGDRYSFRKITEVDKCYIRTEEKSQTSLEMAGGLYSVSLNVDYVSGARNLVKLRAFTLSEVVSSIQGKYLKPLVNTSVEMEDGATELLAVFERENSEKSLIVIISASSL